MVQSPSRAANWSASSQEIPRVSRNPKVHYRTQKRPPQTQNKNSKHMYLNSNITKTICGERRESFSWVLSSQTKNYKISIQFGS